MLPADIPRINSFKGLNNVSDPLRLDLGWLTQSDNCNITSTGALERRSGYTLQAAGAYTSGFNTFDYSRAYFVVGGVIKDFAGTSIKTLTSTDPLYWCEINDQVFFNNGTDSGIILPDNTLLDWHWSAPDAPTVSAVTGNLAPGLYRVLCTTRLSDGRETGASDITEITLTDGQALQISGLGINTNVFIAPANSSVFSYAGFSPSSSMVWNSSPDNLGRDFQNYQLDALPLGCSAIQAFKGQIYAAQYFSSDDQTAIWQSLPLGFHLFDLNVGFILVPGQVHMLAAHDLALIIGTDRQILAYDGKSLVQIADYGVIAGKAYDKDDDGRVLFWSSRGLCAALPFANLTEHNVSVAPGLKAGGCVIRTGGQRRFVAAIQQGGTAFNQY